MKPLISILLSTFILLSSNLFSQDAGSLDPTFNSTGKLTTDNGFLDLYTDVVVQPDGKIIATGMYYDMIYSASIQVARFMPDGSYDPTFGENGLFTFHKNYETDAYACYLKEDGSILVAGITTDEFGAFAMIVLQIDEQGNLDTGFGDSGMTYLDLGPGEDIAYDITTDASGRILVAGFSVNANFLNAPVIIRLTPGGMPDPSFGVDGVATIPVTESDNDFSSVCVQQDGRIIASGHISNGLSWFSLLIAGYDSTGVLDPSFGTEGIVNMNLNNVDDEFFGMSLTSDDEIILSGFTTIPGTIDYHMLLMKFSADGQPDASFGEQGKVIFGENPYNVGNDLVLQTDGRILVAGTSGQKMPGNNDWAIWRFLEDGSPDESFGTNGFITTEFSGEADEALGIALFENKIILAGKARNGSQNFNFAVARYVNDSYVAMPEFTMADQLALAPNPVHVAGEVHLRWDSSLHGPLTLELINLRGERIFTKPIRGNEKLQKETGFVLPASASPGLYLVRLSSTTTSLSGRILVTE